MILYLIGDPHSLYYASGRFKSLLQFVQQQAIPCRVSERNDKLGITVPNVNDISRVSGVIQYMHDNIVSREPDC